MNANSGNDPMLSSFMNEDWGKFQVNPSAIDNGASSLVTSQALAASFLIPPDGLLNLEPHSEFSELTTLWPTERKRVLSIKMEDDDSFSSYSVAGDVDNRDIDMEEIDMARETTGTNIKNEVHDNEMNSHNSRAYKYDISKLQMSEVEARRYVEEQFERIAVVPKSHLNQREKIQFILARSDCTEFAVEDILNFDKKCPDSARACAQIVQNIPQRYRWECVKPEDIPCCYTIVADCKKLSCRDKPPRPMNAFMIWAQSARRLINELCPKMQNALISEALGFYWRQKSDVFKQRFEQEKMKLRRFHSVEFPEYKYKPKTKVQKAREKQELSQTKAKMRASVKLEKLRRTEETCPRRTNTRCGRPRKAKPDLVKKEANPLSSSQYASEKCMHKSPTKPAIKDMLTLKILNDRMCKDTNTRRSRSNEMVFSAFGQMSPLEVDSRGLNEAMDDLSNFDPDLRGKSLSSSVFDTPANTPPVDDDERHHSPLNPQQVSPSAVSTEPSQQTVPNMVDICPVPFTSLPPAVAMLPARSRGIPKDTHNVSLLDLLTKRTSLSTRQQPQPVETSQVLDITDLLFTYVTESLSAAQHGTHSSTSHYPKCSIDTIDANNNNSDINNNYQDNNNNNNNISDLNGSATKPPNFLYEASDLDTLFLDLNVPILTDDDVRTILNTL